MKTFSRIAFIVLVSAFPSLALADALPSVNVPDHCTVSDSNGQNTQTYTGHYLGICALAAAKDQGAVSAYSLSYDAGLGFYLNSINAIVPSGTQFLDLLQNGTEASVGLSTMTLQSGDTLAIQLEQCDANWLNCVPSGSPVSFKVSLVSPQSATPAGASSVMLHDPFSVPLAFFYLRSLQQQDGDFGSPLLDDWVAIASAAGGAGDLRAHLQAYEAANAPALGSATDYERHAMALEALGINPYSGTSQDVITPIVKDFDGTQIGDPTLDNDDIFAIFPLLHAGYSAQDDIIQKTVAFIVAHQHADGSWDGSVDLTGAALQALSLTPSLPDVHTATIKALGYLGAQVQGDGSFGNVSATSWVMQGISAQGEDISQWSKSTYHTADYFLSTKQEKDGGVGPTTADTLTRAWATAYAIPALEHKPWDSLLASFPKPTPAEASAPAPQAATTTPPMATTTVGTSATTTAEVPAPSAPVPDAATTSPQTDGQAAAAAQSGVLDGLWGTIVSFFSHLF
jgi:hypothetical protein